MPRRSRLRLSLAAVGALGWVSPALASFPDPSTSDVPRCLIACPAGDSVFSVVLRDFNRNPNPGEWFAIRFCDCSAVRLGPPPPEYTVDSSGCTIERTADANAVARFPIVAGGVCADGRVLLLTRGFSIAHPFGERSLASPDQNGDLIVGLDDAAIAEGKVGGADPTADFDCDGLVTPADVAILESHLGHRASSTTTVPRGGAAGTVRFTRPPAPNPALGQVAFAVSNPREQEVELAIFDLAGRRIATLWTGRLAAGETSFRWDARSPAGERARAGLYAVRLRAGTRSAARMFTLLR